jgi:cyclic beta-1,2-glucan synthetase
LHIERDFDGLRPIRAELFSVERLEQHAKSLATAQPIGKPSKLPKSLRRRLNENSAHLVIAFRRLAKAAKQGQQITSAGEWFLDNFHIVEEQIRKAQSDLPANFYNELPKLADGPLTGYPRVYGITWALVAHTDGAFDLDRLERFVSAYQEVDPLNIGELWAIAITLRITLVENLRRLIEIVVNRLSDSARAETFAQQVLAGPSSGTGSWDPGRVSATFITRLEQRLRSQNAAADAVLSAIETQLRTMDTSSDSLIHQEYQLQGADDISVRNIINAMRLVSNIDWAEFFENVSLTDRALREYPGYQNMDFPTRDRYRRAVEKLARRAPMDEIAIATAAVHEAAAVNAHAPARQQDPGYYLIGKGRRAFQEKMRYRPSWRQRFWRKARATGLPGYLIFLGLTAAAILLLALAATASLGLDADILPLLAFVGFVPASELATALVNRVVTNRWAPKILPALSLKGGVPDSLSTVLVVPVLLTNDVQVREQVAGLEIHYLSNPDARLQFILLSDWADADSETTPGDAPLLQHARDGIAELNSRYARGGPPLFILLHRRRLWNPMQGRWMGWERKRGKLHELNRLLRGADDTSFLDGAGARATLPPDVQYVITLDADTRLPRGAAKRLIGKMAHPLNLPEYDPVLGRVSHGYGILQPRVTPSLPIGSESSLFQWAFSGPNGLDPYAFAVSDVYQDLFEEGSFVGKGIYNVDAFEQALLQQIPENTVLSHDLLEGVFARAALASDIEVVEEFPSRYDVEVARQHRWMRGDWQLLPWILGFGHREKARGTRVPALGRWKMLDNIRRSLSAPAALLAFLIGWQLPTPAAWVWTAFLALVISLPPLLPILSAVIPRRKGFSLRGHARNMAHDLILASTQILFNVTFLARIAYLALDAILRTVFRLFVVRRNLLEWVTFAQTAYNRRSGSKGLTFQLLGSTAFAAVAAGSAAMHGPVNLVIAAPFLLLWLISPLIARWASQAPRVEPHLDISRQDTDALRLAARQTWSFFDRFVTAEDNYLPPDNFQEVPKGALAHRTSPTNIGMYLNVILAARDFGWIGTRETIERLEATVATLHKMERYRGHFLNWYDTENLRSLEPRYVSTVDSGNLAGNLLVVQHACAQMRSPVDAGRIRAGLLDTVAMVQDRAAALPADPLLQSALARLREAIEQSDLSGPGFGALGQQAEKMVQLVRDPAHAALAWQIAALRRAILSHIQDQDAGDLAPRLDAVAQSCREFAQRMEFGFLFDEHRQLLSIGFRIDDQVLDANAYDLLASEARLASFFAIAKGDVPTRHWFHLGRTLTPLGRSSALQSWSGSMFEYLMPSLIMHEPAGSLLALSNRAAVRRQIAYAQRLNIPWGISESQYYALDREQNYQYSGFGVPDLGLKRGLSENTVIAPYASGLAAMINPVGARENLDRLSRMGARGDYGWYEAIDFTRARLPEDVTSVVIKTYMAHHQGMMILGIDNVIHDGAMRERFHAEAMVQAAELLLQERMPRDVAVARLPPEMQTGAITFFDKTPRVPRSFNTPHTAMPRTHLMSNGNYSLMLTASGSGYSRWRGMAVTRWREDPTRDQWGAFIYLRDLRSGRIWSTGYQPTAQEPDQYEAVFSEDRATIRRTDHSLTTVMEVLVSPEDDSEVRRISITNNGTRLREIEVTSYAELALARPADDDAHQAFSKLFVETEYLRETGALLASRRPRSPSEQPIWAAHLSVAESGSVGDVQYETDRGKFLTRGRNARSASAIFEGWPLSNSEGAVLDPIFSLRRRVQIPRGQTVTLAFWTMAAATRDEIIDLVDRHHDAAAFERAATLAATSAQTQLQYLGIGGDDAHLFQLLANYLIYHDESMRAPPEVLEQGGRPASALWGAGISGDLPIALVRISEEEEAPFVTQMLHAHEYWRQKRLAVDLVILNERVSSYAQDLQKSLESQVHTEPWNAQAASGQGRVFLLRADLLGPEGREALRAAARVDLSARRGSLAEQLSKLSDPERDAGATIPRKNKPATDGETRAPFDILPMQFYNGIGGFSPDGHEYIVLLNGGQRTPAPWTNVIANKDFGFQVSAEGGGFCWALNSQQNQINAWSNDPVSNEPSEVIYLKDLDSGEVFCPTAGPVNDVLGNYVARHGQGYSTFEHSGHELETRLTQFVPLEGAVKLGRLKIANTSDRPRRLAVFYYVEWALGATRTAGAAHIVTAIDPETDALFARNPHSDAFAARVAFMDIGGRQSSWTGDRREFLGRNGDHDAPAALWSDAPLSMRVGGGLDPAGALRTDITLEPGSDIDLSLALGQGADAAEARALVRKFRAADTASVLADVVQFWDRTLGAIQIKTPDKAMDLLTNRWLIYQTLSCRFWGRAGFYQASGAYGFRDQLQDSMALCVPHPELAREHLLRAAGRQFPEGDVQHWWLPESGKGVRTRISDDKSWLAYVAAHYLETTGDTGVLDERFPFLQGPRLKDGEHDAFFLPEASAETATLYEHCARALDASLAVGSHGLPLMGTGDWNDGMNRVGENGRGESVWLGWFLHEALRRFMPHAERRHDAPRVAQWLMHMAALKEALEDTGWDGAWYRRGYFDDGFALGSASNRECRIDSIAQSWSVMSGVASPDRARRAMEAVDKYLVRTEDGLMTLFTPPFVASQHDPGYIKGYPAGIRENGGQYTHGVIWTIAAFAMLGNGDRAGELFSMLNPINHARSRTAANRYRVEPYVACGDVYSMAPNVGRGGWTWYSGSAAWMYRVAIEYMLGIRLQGDMLRVEPVIPRSWPQFEATVRHGDATYEILVENPDRCCSGIASLSLDGVALPAGPIPMSRDAGTHRVKITLGEKASAP